MGTLLRWQVGVVRMTRVQELEAPGMRFIVPQATIDNVAGIPWLTPFLAANGDALGSVHALVLEVADLDAAFSRREGDLLRSSRPLDHGQHRAVDPGQRIRAVRHFRV